MDNQHRKISGYKELSQEQIDLMNEVKAEGMRLEALIERLASNHETDPRWIAIAKTGLQQGLMAATRAITKPDFF